jgi:hypothetical protein
MIEENMGDISDDEDSSTDEPVATQTEREILSSIRDKYGDLSRDNFKERMVDDRK